jgi:DHA2 family multidrug resistance protein
VLQQESLRQYWDPATPGGAAALNALINRQSAMIAYIDDFKLMMIVTVLSIPLVMLLASSRQAAKGEEMAVAMD